MLLIGSLLFLSNWLGILGNSSLRRWARVLGFGEKVTAIIVTGTE
jgi:hypothetical protein